MNYAAKRIWPERSASWQHEGEADSAENFALEFAAVEQLAEAVEFVVFERTGGESQYFRVSACAPYQLEPCEPRPANDFDEFVPTFGLALKTFVYMGKVAAIAIAAIIVAYFGFDYIRAWLEG